MLSLATAVALKNAGLIWQADTHDFFGIPNRDMDERAFVIADLLANLDIFRGWPVVTFHGVAEWSLDYILTTEVVWIPTESQLRQQLAARLQADDAGSELQLTLCTQGYTCLITHHHQSQRFVAPTAEEAYAQALLQLLKESENKS